MGKLSKSDEQLSSMEQDSGQCSRNTSCETLGGANLHNLPSIHPSIQTSCPAFYFCLYPDCFDIDLVELQGSFDPSDVFTYMHSANLQIHFCCKRVSASPF